MLSALSTVWRRRPTSYQARHPAQGVLYQVQGVVLNLFRLGRHLLRAAHPRLRRTRAFGVWREVTSV